MAKDFTITSTKDGIITATETPADSLRNNVYLSLTIALGSWWLNPSFGHRLGEIKKLTEGVENRVDQFIRLALNWLVIAGRIPSTPESIVTDIEIAKPNNRILYSLTVTAGNGPDVTIKGFVIVI